MEQQSRARRAASAKEVWRPLIAPPFTPMRADGSVELERIERQFQALVSDGIGGAFVCGSTGEGVSLSLEERRAVAERWRTLAGKDFLIFVHVGCLSVADARALAAHAQQIGADAIAAMAPCYFKPDGVAELVAFCAQVASAAPKLPFYYYHIPSMTGVHLPMADFLPAAGERIPTLAGVKFTHDDLMDFARCCRLDGGRFEMLFGVDQILLAGMAMGARGGIGTTYNLAGPLYNRIVRGYRAGDLAAARADQAQAIEMIAAMMRFGGLPAAKAMMKMIGIDCGPVRPPLRNLPEEQFAELQRRLEEIAFFQFRTAP